MGRELLDVLCRNAERALHANDLVALDEVVQRLEEADPLGLRTRGYRLEWLLRTKRLAEARTLAEQLLRSHPESARVHLLAGRVATEERRHEAALAHYEESQRLHPDSWTRLRIGDALTQLGRFEEAEAALVAVVAERPIARRALAWLYERKGDARRALATIEEHLSRVPDDPIAAAQRLRLRARLAAPEELLEEVETLVELGETPAPELVPEYVDTLLRSGQGAKARAFVGERLESLDERTRTRTAWLAYKLQAYDLAFELFRSVFDARRGDPKFLAAFEAAARRLARVTELVDLYAAYAGADPRLHGRIRRLKG